MTWTTPPTFVAGTDLPAADLNILGADLVYLKGITDGVTFSGVSLTRNSSTSIPNATDTDVTWTAQAFDYGSWWSSGATITVPSSAVPAGYTTIALLVIGHVTWASNGTGARAYEINVNGSIVSSGQISAPPADTVVQTAVDIIVVAAGDTIKVQLNQGSGGSLNASGIGLKLVRFAPVA